ncbi:hypothetical protein 13VO501A_gene0025 [Vibrio phage 13VO501A]|nr:hypothetical protein 13VO501A_gene0025 [Vibrio phage 13VO501A]
MFEAWVVSLTPDQMVLFLVINLICLAIGCALGWKDRDK